MFATLRCRENSFSVERAGPTLLRFTCNNCRSKKLRCSGEQTGCQRCTAGQISCEYTEALYKKRERQRQIGSTSSTNDSIAGRVQHNPTQQPVSYIGTNAYDNTASKDLASPPSGLDSGQLLSFTGNNLDVPNTTFEISKSAVDDFLTFNPRASLSSRPDSVQTTDETGGIWQPSRGVSPSYLAPIYNNTLCLDNSGFGFEDDSLSAAEFGSQSEFQNPRPSLPTSTAFNSQHDAFPEILQSSDQIQSSINGYQDSDAVGTSKTGFDYGKTIPQVQAATFIVPDSERPPINPSTSNETSCQCVLIALNLLEKLQTEDHQSNSDTVDHVLKLSKHALTKCLMLSKCQACMNTSRFTMLLISLCRVVVSSWEKAVSTLGIEQQIDHTGDPTGINDEGQYDDVPEDIASPEGSQVRDPSICLRSYEIDDSEQLYVFAALVRFQLSKWKAFLTRVKSVLSRLELETQSSMLQDLDRRVSRQRDICTELLSDGNMLK